MFYAQSKIKTELPYFLVTFFSPLKGYLGLVTLTHQFPHVSPIISVHEGNTAAIWQSARLRVSVHAVTDCPVAHKGETLCLCLVSNGKWHLAWHLMVSDSVNTNYLWVTDCRVAHEGEMLHISCLMVSGSVSNNCESLHLPSKSGTQTIT